MPPSKSGCNIRVLWIRIASVLLFVFVCPKRPAAAELQDSAQTRHTYVALKTNLLADLLLIHNVGFEAYVGRGCSVGLNWTYTWWSSNAHHHYWRIYGGDVYARWWFGPHARQKPLTGHHVGIYVQAYTYDLELGGTGYGYMGGEPGDNMFGRMNYGAGCEYGFSIPVHKRLNIDFTVGIGYFGGKYYKYKPIDDHYVWQSTHIRHWFGPTKAEVSLVWLLGDHNVNRKGGKNGKH